LLGDKDSDILAGRAAGVGHNLKLVQGAREIADASRLEFGSLQAVGDWLECAFD
jgi:hypothetical protein